MVGYLWPFVLAPLAFLAGPDFLDGLPVIVLLQVLVLGPIALLCAYFIAARIGGRLLGYFAAAAWIAAPFARPARSSSTATTSAGTSRRCRRRSA